MFIKKKKARECRFTYQRGAKHFSSLISVHRTLNWVEISQKSNSELCVITFTISTLHPTIHQHKSVIPKSQPNHFPWNTGKKISIIATFLSWKQGVWSWIMFKKTEFLQDITILFSGFETSEKLSVEKKYKLKLLFYLI